MIRGLRSQPIFFVCPTKSSQVSIIVRPRDKDNGGALTEGPQPDGSSLNHRNHHPVTILEIRLLHKGTIPP